MKKNQICLCVYVRMCMYGSVCKAKQMSPSTHFQVWILNSDCYKVAPKQLPQTSNFTEQSNTTYN